MVKMYQVSNKMAKEIIDKSLKNKKYLQQTKDGRYILVSDDGVIHDNIS